VRESLSGCSAKETAVCCKYARPGVPFPGVKLLAAVLGAVLIVLTPLVHGSPIDPSTPGFWDDGDFDDVILFLSFHLQLIEPEDLPDPGVYEAIVRDVTEEPYEAITEGSYEPGCPRAPPVA
jgi:hypothetical protein